MSLNNSALSKRHVQELGTPHPQMTTSAFCRDDDESQTNRKPNPLKEHEQIDDLRAAKASVRGQLLQLGLGGRVIAKRPTLSVNAAIANAGRSVHALDIGRKMSAGKETEELCVRIYVIQKLAESLLSPRDRLPKKIDGLPTDVIESPPAFALLRKPAARKKKKPTKVAATASCTEQRRERQRPVIAGISRDITAGTIGCYCTSTRSSDRSGVCALSNNHVFANVNAATEGDPLFQPGPADGGVFEDHFANLHRFEPIVLGGTVGNKVDAAIGRVLEGVPHDPAICSIGSITGTLNATESMLVRKHGRTTGLTQGKITDADHDALVGMDHNDPSVVALFEDQLRIETTNTSPIGLGGDSGSAVVHRTQNKVVGLYFAGPDTGFFGLANKIQNVISELDIAIP